MASFPLRTFTGEQPMAFASPRQSPRARTGSEREALANFRRRIHWLSFEPLEDRIAPDATPLTLALALTDPDDVIVRLNGSQIQIVDADAPGSAPLASQQLADTSAVLLTGADGRADKLTIDYSHGGPFSLPGGISFAGGSGMGDALAVKGGGNLTWNLTGPNAGHAGGGAVQFSGVENLAGAA